MTKTALKVLVLSLTALSLASFDLPADWITAGSHPKSYYMGIEKGAGPDGKNVATIKSVNKKIDGFGTLMQMCWADKYAGKRVRMSGLVKSNDIKEWAGLWFRVDLSSNAKPLAFDNMKNRGIKGTTEWNKYEIVLDVPQRAVGLAFGALVSGTGQIWFTNIQFEIVDLSVPTTDLEKKTLEVPTNLNFDN